jgi:endonuclease YncB( thermonuclease family)
MTPLAKLMLAGGMASALTFGAAVDSGFAGPVSARVTQVIDGDSLKVKARIWIGQEIETNVRIVGIDTPELRGRCESERVAARRARDFLTERIEARDVRLRDIRHDKYGGRVLARIETDRGEDLAALLVAQGLARPYGGGARVGWCPAGTR